MIFIILFLLSFLAIYIVAVAYYNDFSVPNLNLDEFLKTLKNHRVLVIFPHPDDEVMASGGLISQLVTRKDTAVKVVSVTSGQYGNEKLKIGPKELGEIRTKEFHSALKKLNSKDNEILDLVDGNLTQDYSNLLKSVEKLVVEFKPSLIVTYERSGVYGHPDHIALSKAVYEVGKMHADIKILYSTLSPKILSKVKLPTHIDGVPIPNFKKQMLPEMKLPVISQNLNKYLAAREYKSQVFGKKFQMEFLFLINLYEYYTTKYD